MSVAPEHCTRIRHKTYLLALSTAPANAPLYATSHLIKLTAAQFTLADTPTPPADNADWKNVSLIDKWDIARYQQGDNGWYRLPLDLPTTPGDAWASTCHGST